MARSPIALALVIVAACAAVIGCSGGNQDGELPKDDPIIGKPVDQSATKDPNAARAPEGATKPGFGK